MAVLHDLVAFETPNG